MRRLFYILLLTLAVPLPAWESQLFPWGGSAYSEATVNFNARNWRLLDFSYAGFELGAKSPGDNIPCNTYTVTGTGNITAELQGLIAAAIAAGGGRVLIPAGSFTISATIEVDGSNVSIEGAGSSLTFINIPNTYTPGDLRYEGVFTLGKASGGFSKGWVDRGAVLADVTADIAEGDSIIAVSTTVNMVVGDWITVRQYFWPTFSNSNSSNTWPSFSGWPSPITAGNRSYSFTFLRRILAVGAGSLTLDAPITWPLQMANNPIKVQSAIDTNCGGGCTGDWIQANYNLGVSGMSMTFADNWNDTTFTPNRPTGCGVFFEGVHNGWAYDIKLYNIPRNGIYLDSSARITLSKNAIYSAQDDGGSGFGYGFHIAESQDVLVKNNYVEKVRHGYISQRALTHNLVWTNNESAQNRLGDDSHHSFVHANLWDQHRSRYGTGFRSEERGTTSGNAWETLGSGVVWNSNGDCSRGGYNGGTLHYNPSFDGYGLVIGDLGAMPVRDGQATTGDLISANAGLQVGPTLDAPGPGSKDQNVLYEGMGTPGLVPASLYETQRANRLGAALPDFTSCAALPVPASVNKSTYPGPDELIVNVDHLGWVPAVGSACSNYFGGTVGSACDAFSPDQDHTSGSGESVRISSTGVDWNIMIGWRGCTITKSVYSDLEMWVYPLSAGVEFRVGLYDSGYPDTTDTNSAYFIVNGLSANIWNQVTIPMASLGTGTFNKFEIRSTANGGGLTFYLDDVVLKGGATPTATFTATPSPTGSPSQSSTPTLSASTTATPTASPTPTVLSIATAPGFYVNGRFLYSPCGEKVILRGFNAMTVWAGADKSGASHMAQIAMTGANAVRIVWTTAGGTAAEMDTAISNAIANNLIPIIENHDATGNLAGVPAIVNWWTSPAIVAVIQAHEKYLLVNIANEPGDGTETPAQFRTTHQNAVTAMRGAGINVPLIIDAPNWGQDINTLQSEWAAINGIDPLQNTMYSIHMWWPNEWGYSKASITAEINQSVAANMPLLIGEFAQQGTTASTCFGTIEWAHIIQEATLNQIGYLPWSWGVALNTDCAAMSATCTGLYSELGDALAQCPAMGDNSYALTVVNDPLYGIAATSVRPQYILNGFICATPTATATETETETPTVSRTETHTNSPSMTLSPSLTATISVSASPTVSETYTASATQTPNGTFTPTPTASRTPDKPYHAGELRTNVSYLYGRFETRFRAAAADGVVSSFFTFNDDAFSVPNWNEIDIEILGRYSDRVDFNVITYNQVNHNQLASPINPDPTLCYHDYAIEWTPTYVAWFIDGVQVAIDTGAYIAELTFPQKLMMNLWPPNTAGWSLILNPADLKQHSFYDYVSVYSYTPGAGTAGTGNNFSLLWTDNFNSFDPARWSKATHTFAQNDARFDPQNVEFIDGHMVLSLTAADDFGYPLATVPLDCGSTPTDTATITASVTKTPTETMSPSRTASPTSSVMPSQTVETATETLTYTPFSGSATYSPTKTKTATITLTLTPTISASPSQTITQTITPSLTATPSITSATFTRTATKTVTATPSPSSSPIISTATVTPTVTLGISSGEGSAAINPASAPSGDLNASVSVVFTAGVTAFSNGLITVQVPPEFSLLQITDQTKPNFTAVSSEGSVGSPLLFGTLLTVPVTSLATGQSMTVVFGSQNSLGEGGLTMPTTPASYTFMVSSAPAGGVPSPLAAQPVLKIVSFVDGPLKINQALAVPNPVQGLGATIMLDLAGSAEEVRVKIYTPGMTLVGELSAGPFYDGWARVPLSGAMFEQLSSGLYFFVVRAIRGEAQSPPRVGKMMILK